MLKDILKAAITIILLAYFLPTVSFLNWTTLLLAAIVMTLLNKVARPILNLLFLPINVVTLGLFSLVITVGLLWLVTFLVPGFSIEPMILFGMEFNQFFSLLIVSLFISFFQSLIGIFIR